MAHILEKYYAEKLEVLTSELSMGECKELVISILDLFNIQMVIHMIERCVTFLPMSKDRGFLRHMEVKK